jgi:hypothetical protein
MADAEASTIFVRGLDFGLKGAPAIHDANEEII